jgi:hypothetical protein
VGAVAARIRTRGSVNERESRSRSPQGQLLSMNGGEEKEPSTAAHQGVLATLLRRRTKLFSGRAPANPVRVNTGSTRGPETAANRDTPKPGKDAH